MANRRFRAVPSGNALPSRLKLYRASTSVIMPNKACNGKSYELAKLGSTNGVPFTAHELELEFAHVYAGFKGDFFCA